MSTKIWQAWRVPISKLNGTLFYLKERMIEEYVYPSYKRLMNEALAKLTNEEDWGKYGDKYCAAESTVGNLLKESSLNLYNIVTNLDCFIEVTIEGKYCYLIPFGYYLDEGTVPKDLVDFHYQNQVDSKLSPKEDKKRAKKWAELRQLPQLTFSIFDGKGLDHYELSRRYYQEEYNE